MTKSEEVLFIIFIFYDSLNLRNTKGDIQKINFNLYFLTSKIMINFFKKIFIFIFFLSSILVNFNQTSPINNVNAAATDFSKQKGFGNSGKITSQFSEKNRQDIRLTIANVVKVVLSCMGLVFVIMIIWAGWTWMTAGGNEEKVKTSMAQIRNGIIGLIIIMGAWAITVFVTESINTAVSTKI